MSVAGAADTPVFDRQSLGGLMNSERFHRHPTKFFSGSDLYRTAPHSTIGTWRKHTTGRSLAQLCHNNASANPARAYHMKILHNRFTNADAGARGGSVEAGAALWAPALATAWCQSGRIRKCSKADELRARVVDKLHVACSRCGCGATTRGDNVKKQLFWANAARPLDYCCLVDWRAAAMNKRAGSTGHTGSYLDG